jgi:hypothetical protein
MYPYPIPYDDIVDVIEMTDKIKSRVLDIFEETDPHLAVSALIGASTQCMLLQCTTLDEVKFYRNLFMQILDDSIKTIRIQGT